MEDFAVIILSDNHILYDNLIENYQSFKLAQNLPTLETDQTIFKFINLGLDDWLAKLSNHKKIDILILDSDLPHSLNLHNLSSKLQSFINNRVSKLINLSSLSFSEKEISLPKPLVLIELLEIIDGLHNADGMFKSLSSGWIYCSNTARLQRDGEIIKLTDKESSLIEYLLGLNDHKTSKSDLFNQLWNYNPNSETSTLDTHLYKLRQKLPENMFIIEGNICFLNI